MRITVVGSGKDRSATRRPVRQIGPRGPRGGRQPRCGRDGQRREGALPGRGPPRGVPRGCGGRGSLTATTDTSDAVSHSDAVVVVVPLFVDAEARPDFGWMDSATDDIARGTTARTTPSSATRRRCPWARRGLAGSPGWRPDRASSRVATSTSSSLRSGCSRVGSSPTCAGTRSWSGRSRPTARRERSSSTSGAPVRRATRPRARQRGLGPRLCRGGGAGQAGGDDLPRRQHRPGEPVRPLRCGARHRRLPGDRGEQLAALQPHPPPGHRRRRPLHPGLSAPLPLERSRRDRGPSRSRGQRRRCRRTPSASRPGRSAATSPGARSRCSAPSYRGGVKETAFSGVFATVDALRDAGADVASTTRCTPRRARRLRLGTPTSSASRWTSSSCRRTMPSIATWESSRFPGVQVVVDGRHVLDERRFDGTRFLVVGRRGSPEQAAAPARARGPADGRPDRRLGGRLGRRDHRRRLVDLAPRAGARGRRARAQLHRRPRRLHRHRRADGRQLQGAELRPRLRAGRARATACSSGPPSCSPTTPTRARSTPTARSSAADDWEPSG